MSKDKNSQVELVRKAYFASREVAQEQCLDIVIQVFPELQMAQCLRAIKDTNRLALLYAGVLNNAKIVTPSSVQYGVAIRTCDFSFGTTVANKSLILPPTFFMCLRARQETLRKATAELNSAAESTKQRS